MRVLMAHPHDLESNLEPWTVRVTYLARELRAAGHEVVLIHHALGGTPGPAKCLAGTDILALPLVRYSRTLHKKNQILAELAAWADIVHFQKCLSYTALPAVRAAYRVGIPVHYDWDDWEYEIYNYNPMERVVGRSIDRIERALPGLVDTVSVASDGLRELCVGLGFPPELIVKVPVGAEISRFHPRVDGRVIRERHDIDGPIVLYVGQLHGAQYLEHLLEAFVAIRARHPDAVLLVVGGGDRFGELHRLGEQLGINDATVFTGAVSHEEIPSYMAAADVAVAPFEDTPQTRCKSPLKVAEYLAMGKAIVGTAMGEVELMLGGGAGLLYPAGDIRALAHNVCRVLESPDLRRELEAGARQRSEAVYNWRSSAESLLAGYEMALALHAGRRRKVFAARLRVPAPTGPGGGAPTTRSVLRWWPRRVVGFVEHHRSLVGIFHGEHAFRGPGLVQLDVTNNCNNDCIACWCNSPFLGDRRMTPEVKRQHLPLTRVVELLDELWQMGTREIYMAGGGEPFMHPDIMAIVRKVKQLGFTLFINTNFTLVDRARAQQLIDLGVDHLTVSMWAGTAETYSLVHPNKTQERFTELCDVLRFMNQRKRERPLVKLYQVISCLNFHEIPEMVRLAHQTGCESVEFTLVDTMPDATESLLLNDSERRRALKLVQQARQEAALGVELFNIDLFERRISNTDSTRGEHDSDFIHSIPCTIGWTFSRILPDGNVNACLKAHRIPVGNIFEQSFREIWNSEAQRSFRRHTNVLQKTDPFFRQIGNDPSAECGCVKSCDDIGRNLHTVEAIGRLSRLQRLALEQAAKRLGPEVRGAE